MSGMRKHSVPPQYRTRGLVALGICSIVMCLWLSVLPVGATEMETPMIEPQETEEVILDSDIDDTGTIVDGISDSDIGSEIGPDSTENEMEDETLPVGCTCGEEIIRFLESQTLSEPVVYQTPEELEDAPALLSRYEYEVIKRLEFLQYAGLILIGLLFILIFKKK